MRITELRGDGKSPDQAIREGYNHGGEVITSAGIVMAVAFSGLATSEIPIIRDVGPFLAVSVLFNTFVVRMLTVPAIFHLLGRLNSSSGNLSAEEEHATLA
jgi:uncharacterized membrane protein YdfJ with MMPL/SSD domain